MAQNVSHSWTLFPHPWNFGPSLCFSPIFPQYTCILSNLTATGPIPFHSVSLWQSLSTHMLCPSLSSTICGGFPSTYVETIPAGMQALARKLALAPTNTRPLIHHWVFLLGMVASSLVPIAHPMLSPVLFECPQSRLAQETLPVSTF